MDDQEKRKNRQEWDSPQRALPRIEISGMRYNYFSTEEQRRQHCRARRGRRMAVGFLVFAATVGLGGWRFFILPGATALCNDGSQSFSRHSSGTCNYHGGVKRWL
jgi:Protein of unknown function (DUF3761)